MSNYVYGSFMASSQDVVTAVADALRGRSAVVFRVFEPGDIPLVSDYHKPSDTHLFRNVPGFRRVPGAVFFCLTDGEGYWEAEDLTVSSDWGPEAEIAVPFLLRDRIALIVDIITTIAELSGSPVVELWITESYDLEGVMPVPLSSLGETLARDFASRGTPCLLYEIST